jgi:hypothetical protein
MGNATSGVAEIKSKGDIANLHASLRAHESARRLSTQMSSKRFKKEGATQWRVRAFLY